MGTKYPKGRATGRAAVKSPAGFRKRARGKADRRPAHLLPLLAVEEEFILRYLANGGNATQAYLGTHPAAKHTTARTEGSRLLAKPNVRRSLSEQLAGRKSRLKMDAEEALELVAHRARASIGELFDPTTGELLPPQEWPLWMQRCVKSYRPDPDGGPATVILHDSMKALELILTVEGKLRNQVDVLHKFDGVGYLASKTPA
jgi:hypothetical protein